VKHLRAFMVRPEHGDCREALQPVYPSPGCNSLVNLCITAPNRVIKNKDRINRINKIFETAGEAGWKSNSVNSVNSV
jgi:hypothetical protein